MNLAAPGGFLQRFTFSKRNVLTVLMFKKNNDKPWFAIDHFYSDVTVLSFLSFCFLFLFQSTFAYHHFTPPPRSEEEHHVRLSEAALQTSKGSERHEQAVDTEAVQESKACVVL